MNKSIKIGGASGFWGDSFIATSQLLNADNNLDFIVYDYLAEITMSILARARSKDPNLVCYRFCLHSHEDEFKANF